MNKLIYNELIKTYIRKSTWIMYIILAGLIIGGAALTLIFDEVNDTSYDNNWRETLQAENETLLKENEEASEEEGFIVDMNMDTIGKNSYYLENDIKPKIGRAHV